MTINVLIRVTASSLLFILNNHLFIFCKCFVLIRVVGDPEPIPGALSEKLVCESPSQDTTHVGMFLGGWWKLVNPEETRMDMERACTAPDTHRGVNSSCEAPTLTAAPMGCLFYMLIDYF